MINYTQQIETYIQRLFPICRSITGNGNRETLNILKEIIPLAIKEYPSGQQVFDWIIPKEWNICDAWIKNSQGIKVVDFKNSNLHVVSYSSPVHKKMSAAELTPHLHYIESQPDAIPYRTSYFNEDWGFCLSYNDFQKYFKQGEYEVFIDSELKQGSLSIGEILIPGKSSKEILISTYICHPSLANDNLSGAVMTAFLAKELSKRELNYSYRIVFVPETIGAIAYCANNKAVIKSIDCGFVVTCVGGAGKYSYKQSFDKSHFINQLIEKMFEEDGLDYVVYSFDIHGSDERQYSSPGFRINIASICRDKYYEYLPYHTCLDNLQFIKAEYINKSLELYLKTVAKIDINIKYISTNLDCETMLSKHGLYPQKGGGLLPGKNIEDELDLILWLLFYCDGTLYLQEIANKMECSIEKLNRIASILESKKLLKRCE